MFAAFAVALRNIIDTILPRKERVVRIDSYTLDSIPVNPVTHEIDGASITTLLTYRTPVAEDLIRALKYDRSDHAAHLLASALAEYLREETALIRLFSPLPIVLVPIPLHISRERERGFNQIEYVLRKLPKEFSDGTLSSVRTDILMRNRATKPQTQLSRSERLLNVRGAFACTQSIVPAHFILIDDVTTTGSTLIEAGKLLPLRSYSLLALAHA